jgi:hypothetical protein
VLSYDEVIKVIPGAIVEPMPFLKAEDSCVINDVVAQCGVKWTLFRHRIIVLRTDQQQSTELQPRCHLFKGQFQSLIGHKM